MSKTLRSKITGILLLFIAGAMVFLLGEAGAYDVTGHGWWALDLVGIVALVTVVVGWVFFVPSKHPTPQTEQPTG